MSFLCAKPSSSSRLWENLLFNTPSTLRITEEGVRNGLGWEGLKEEVGLQLSSEYLEDMARLRGDITKWK